MTSLGIRNNNPGNLDASTIPWLGQTGSAGRFVVFDTPVHGVRALAKNLLAYQDRHGLRTIVGIISRWAPPGENNTAAYISAVASFMGVGSEIDLNLHDLALLSSLVSAIILHENGSQPYPPSLLAEGVGEALA